MSFRSSVTLGASAHPVRAKASAAPADPWGAILIPAKNVEQSSVDAMVMSPRLAVPQKVLRSG